MMMIMLTINMLFIFLNHPMSMGLTLIVQTLIMSLISGMLIKSFWMSYILMITMLSGMLVLFIYMSSIASNEKFKTSINLWMMFIIMVMSSMFLFPKEKMIIKNNYLGMEMLASNSNMFYLNKLFNMENMMITIMMVMYLLLTMIVSSFLVNISEGPMRLKI